jgi:hypothetical protein
MATGKADIPGAPFSRSGTETSRRSNARSPCDGLGTRCTATANRERAITQETGAEGKGACCGWGHSIKTQDRYQVLANWDAD